MRTDLSAKDFAAVCHDIVMTMAMDYVQRTADVPENSTLDIWFCPNEVWADAGNMMYRLACLDELLEDDTFTTIVTESDDFLLFATNGDGN